MNTKNTNTPPGDHITWPEIKWPEAPDEVIDTRPVTKLVDDRPMWEILAESSKQARDAQDDKRDTEKAMRRQARIDWWVVSIVLLIVVLGSIWL